MGRSLSAVPDDTELCEELSYKARYHIIHEVTKAFWCQWSVSCTSKLVRTRKGGEVSTRDVHVGDLVMVADKTALKAKYRLAIVLETSCSSDGRMRSTISIVFDVICVVANKLYYTVIKINIVFLNIRLLQD